MSNRKTETINYFSLKPLNMLIVLITFILAGAFSVCFAAQPAAKDVLVKWGNKVITKQDIDRRINMLPEEEKERFQGAEQKKMFLESLIRMRIVGAEARSQKLDKKTDIAIQLSDQADIVLFNEYMKQKIGGLKPFSDSDAEKYYKSHQSEFVNPKQVKAQHILLSLKPDAKKQEIDATMVKAQGIVKEIKDGGDFAKLAEKYSEDPGSKSNGGELGFFNKHQMVPEFSKAAFAMKKDEVSVPVKTEYGIHIIKVTDIIDEQPITLKDATPGIINTMESERQSNIVKAELERLKKKYNVRMMDTK